MNQFKVLFPFIAALGVYLLALNSPMYKQMNDNRSVENVFNANPIEGFKYSI